MTLQIDSLCDRFEAAWQHGQRPNLADWLAESPTALAELAALELHYRLQHGDAVSAGDYFTQYPQLLADRAAAVRLVGVEYRAALRTNPNITEQHFRERYPELATCQDWSNGPWAGETPSLTGTGTLIQKMPTEAITGNIKPILAGTGTMIQQLPSREPPPPQNPEEFPFSILEPASPQHPDDLGRLADYRIVGVVGRGGMGAVLKGINAISGHPAAIKVMLPDEAKRPTARERFLREARTAQTIDHPRVVPIYHVGEVKTTPYIAMKLLEGQSLRERLDRGPALSLLDIVRFGREIAEGLQAAHRHHLVHRDLKPDNVWLESTADGVHVRLLDFGLARTVEGGDSLTQAGAIVGTPPYMSPEQADGHDVDARSDLWSLGVVLYRLISNKLPFGDGPILKVLKAIGSDTPKPLVELAPSTPTKLSQLVERLLAKSPSDRPANAAEVIRELTALETVASQTGQASTVQLPPPRKRRPIVLSCTVTVALLAFVAIGIVANPWRDATSKIGPTAAIIPEPMEKTPLAVPSPIKSVPQRLPMITITHFAKINATQMEPRGVLGKQSFEATFGDQVTLEVQLEQPAYCYLVAFRPDGVTEVIFPESETEVPPMTARPRYPSKSRAVNYGLTDGSGLWVFGVVASPTPLKSFAEATKGKPSPKVAGGESAAKTVWWDNSDSVEALTSVGVDRGTRGQGATMPGKSHVTLATEWLKSLVGEGAEAGAIGFMVRPK